MITSTCFLLYSWIADTGGLCHLKINKCRFWGTCSSFFFFFGRGAQYKLYGTALVGAFHILVLFSFSSLRGCSKLSTSIPQYNHLNCCYFAFSHSSTVFSHIQHFHFTFLLFFITASIYCHNEPVSLQDSGFIFSKCFFWDIWRSHHCVADAAQISHVIPYKFH